MGGDLVFVATYDPKLLGEPERESKLNPIIGSIYGVYLPSNLLGRRVNLCQRPSSCAKSGVPYGDCISLCFNMIIC